MLKIISHVSYYAILRESCVDKAHIQQVCTTAATELGARSYYFVSQAVNKISQKLPFYSRACHTSKR